MKSRFLFFALAIAFSLGAQAAPSYSRGYSSPPRYSAPPRPSVSSPYRGTSGGGYGLFGRSPAPTYTSQNSFMSGWRRPASPAPSTPVSPGGSGARMNFGGSGSAGNTLGRAPSPSGGFRGLPTANRPGTPGAGRPAGFAGTPGNGKPAGFGGSTNKSGFVAPPASKTALKNGDSLEVSPHRDGQGYNTFINHQDGSRTMINTRARPDGTTQTTISRQYKDSQGRSVTDYGNKQVTSLPGGGHQIDTPFGTRVSGLGSSSFRGTNGYSYTDTHGSFTAGGHTYEGIQRTVVVNHQTTVYNYRSVSYGSVYVPTFGFPGYYWHPWISPFYYSPGFFCLWCAPVPVFGIYPYGHPFASLLAFATFGLLADVVYNNYEAQQANAIAQQRALENQLQLQQNQLQVAQQSADQAQITALSQQVATLQRELDQQNKTVADLKANQQVQSHLTDGQRTQLERQAQQTADALKNGQGVTLEDVIHSPDFTSHLFVVGTDRAISATDEAGQVCSLAGDIIKFDPSETPELSRGQSKMLIETSTDSSCPAGQSVNVRTSDLQDMLNDFATKLQEKLQQADKAHPSHG